VASVNEKGVIDLEKLGKQISEQTVLVSIMLVNNELGTIQPIKDIAQIIEKIRQKRLAEGNKLPLYLHTDAAQAPNYLDIHVSRLGVDMLSLNGGKIYGPKQTGVLYIKTGTTLRPLFVGGGQEFGLRSGTENVAGFIGLAYALKNAQAKRAEETQRISDTRQQFEKKLQEIYSKAVINGASKSRTPHIISVTFPGLDNERLMMELDERGVQVAVGSACNASSDEPSHVLSVMGLNDDLIRSTIRFSLGRQTNQEQINQALKALKELLVANR
jgi:cysteine desulfurase